MKVIPEHIRLGMSGEARARRFLAGKGWRIRAYNWRPQGAAQRFELDIVAQDSDTLVFVEVKTRRHRKDDRQSGGAPAALAGFSASKRQRLQQAAQHYLAAHHLWDMPCRFDLICLDIYPARQVMEHFSHVMEFEETNRLGHSLGGGDSSWQPW